MPETPINMGAWIEEEGWFYRFRLKIWYAVGKILRVN